MTGSSLFRGAIALALLALFASCAEMESPNTAGTAAVAPTPAPGYWNGDGVPGSPKIVVSIAEQHAYFYKGKNLVGESTVSTGKPGFGTPPGHYSVVWKDKDHVSTVFGDYVDDLGTVVKSNIDSRKDSKPPGSHYDGARMPYAMFFRGGYAMHQGYVPPYAASHGCIRLPAVMAETFFNNTPYGTPVIVKQEAVMRSVTVPVLNPVPTTIAPPAPQLVRTTAPAPVRPAAVRATVPAPTPPPLRPPAPLRYPVPSPAPVSVRPASVRSPGPAPTLVPVRSPSPAPLRSPVLSHPPAPLRSPVPTPAPVRSPLPAPVRSPLPAPIRSPALSPATASVHPTPAPVRSRKQQRVHSRPHRHSPAPSPTPAQ